MQTIGERIRYERMTHKMSMQALANVLGKSKGNISEYEKGKYEPSAQTVIALSRIFNVSADWLLTGEEYLNNSEDSTPLLNLSDMETDLISMFRLLDERDQEDAYDNIYYKYKRVYKDSSLYQRYALDRVAEETAVDYKSSQNKND
ncbi:helix-turn-helix domain-containing protein [Anaerocolumna sedimenticola]|uniref:Helix-turn-helix domain-containing protein n=1 Tax=Anaerocolumna sedimenticola TaxID=2696063 RepID=A0A6P1TI66_9FIRM|nr:helix-turn-helix domain-containing protein [Anaerocolumna sedimenticola]QHQ59616.1 helix-turn-helix domain-containing protein [Anaerocolumna sedimenticola]